MHRARGTQVSQAVRIESFEEKKSSLLTIFSKKTCILFLMSQIVHKNHVKIKKIGNS